MSPAKKAATSENGRRSFSYGGVKLDLPGKMPFVVMRHLSDDEPVKVLTAIVGEKQMEKVWDAGLDIDQGREMTEKIIELYDMTAGKSSASARS